MNYSRLITALCASIAATSAARAQNSGEPYDDPAATEGYYESVHGAFDAWNAEHGGNWQLHYETETGSGRFLFGGALEPAFVPHSDADFFTLARAALEQTFAIHRIDASTLVEDETMFLPLGNAGSCDKQTVQFRQVVDGVPVIHGFANVLFDMRGRVLSIDATGLPGLVGFPTSPSITGERAAEIATGLFAQDERLPATKVVNEGLAIDPVLDVKFLRPALVWVIDVQFESNDMDAAGHEYRIDAFSGRLSSRHESIHTYDVSGTVTSMATPGTFPDIATNPPQALVMPALNVTSSSGNATTDTNGNFNIIGATAPLTVTVEYEGPWCTVTDVAQSAFTQSPSLTSSTGNAILMNSSPTAFVNAEANAFLATTLQRFWTRSINSADGTHDFQAVANVNRTGTCNAFYNGTSTNFYQPFNGCVNTAFCDVVLHETGHWMNDRYGSGNGGDGFGEGNADNFATYFTDDPVLGHGFGGPGTYVRSGLNTRLFCGDNHPACYGEVHDDGEVLMGAIWKVRARFKTALGSSAGIVAANTLFNSWMNAYNDSQIRTIIEKHWLVLDDNDGNLLNLTPNFAHIDGGFRDQGFDLPAFVFSQVTQLPNTQNQVGPYAVSANVTPEFSPQTASVTLRYRINGASFVSLPMSNTTGNTWSAAIPGQSCTSFIDYYISATDGGGRVATYPYRAPQDAVLSYYVGNLVQVAGDDFESGVGGWTHAQVATQDDWQISSQFPVNISYGKAGDPTAPATSGTSIWGNDLGNGTFNGYYSANVSNYLRSPVFNCTGVTGVILKFNRWLRVEKSQYDQAEVKVNGNVVWTNPFSTDQLDNAWVQVLIDISQYADNNPSVQIEFSLVSDAGLEYGGWNIDDLQLVYFGSCGPVCAAPTSYCTSKTTSLGGTPVVSSQGTSTLTANNFSVRLSGAPPMRQAICFWGDTTGATPYTGGFNCVGLPFHRGTPTVTDASGNAVQLIPIDASMVGTQRHYQWWFRDPPDPFHVGLSNGLTVTFCN